MTLFLTSSPCLNGLDRAELNPANEFVARMKAALPPDVRCLFICSSPDTPEMTERFGQDMRNAFQEAGMPFARFAVLDSRNEDDAPALVANSNFIILAGGHVPTQNAFFQHIGLAGLLQDYTGVIMGISAGTMNAASTVYAQPELEGEALDPEYERFLPGLGLTDVMILPHYQMVRGDWLDGMRLFEDITYADSHGHTFYALPDGSYLYRRGGKTLLLGEAYRICDGVMEQVSENGRKLTLSKG